LARRLISKGFKSIQVLEGGWQDWLRSEYPIEEKSPLLR
jgi:3-mercaptopyruvate sulfurtransferase SseA